MFLSKRDLLALVLLVIAAVGVALGIRIIRRAELLKKVYLEETTAVWEINTEVTTSFEEESTMIIGSEEQSTIVSVERAEATSYKESQVESTTAKMTENATEDVSEPVTEFPKYKGEQKAEAEEEPLRVNADFWPGILLLVLSLAVALAATIFLWQKKTILGPDGTLFLGGVAVWLLTGSDADADSNRWGILLAGGTFLLMCNARELWGWGRRRFCLSDLLLRRVSFKAGKQGHAVLIYILAGVTTTCLIIQTISLELWGASVLFLLFLAVLVACGLWFGKELNRFSGRIRTVEQEVRDTPPKSGSFYSEEKELIEIRKRQEQAVQEAVAGERFKVELISNVSHDLRTPLTSILGYGELLRKEEMSEKGREQLDKLNQKAGYMSGLVDSIFELTKVSSGVVEAKKEKIDLISVLEQTVGLLQDELDKVGLPVKREYEIENCPLISDGYLLHQVFTNLLGNAVKYALSGTRIYISVKMDGDSIVVCMMNTASYEMDFSPEEILQRFTRGDKARTGQGSGLGLAIAKTYTEAVGGHFHVEVSGDQFRAVVTVPRLTRTD